MSFDVAMTTLGYTLGLVLYIAMVVDVARPSTAAYEQAGTSKVLWLLLVALVGLIPWIIYAAMFRSRVRNATA